MKVLSEARPPIEVALEQPTFSFESSLIIASTRVGVSCFGGNAKSGSNAESRALIPPICPADEKDVGPADGCGASAGLGDAPPPPDEDETEGPVAERGRLLLPLLLVGGPR